MRQRRQKSGVSNRLINILLVVMLGLVGLVIWRLIPALAGDVFGEPSPYLTSSQQWSYGLQLILHEQELTEGSCIGGQSVPVVIAMGDSINQITTKLVEAGVILHADPLRNYLIYKGIDTNIRAGNYFLTCADSPIKIADAIENHTLESVEFDILPGWRAEEIAAALSSSGIEVSGSDFLKAVNHPANLQLPKYLQDAKSVEGFLLPGKYTIKRNISARDLVQTFISQFDQQVSAAGLVQENMNGLSMYQTVILASIVQRESYANSERPMIASVFFNRLAAGMKLETDPTVQYTLGYDQKWGWWKSPLSSSDLAIQSDYNTYQIIGLPPAPIANPDLSSIQAVENPVTSDYYYFRAKCDDSGTHVFAKTLEEQMANACK
jgi:UPF0755 protein